MIWTETATTLPDECRPVIGKCLVDGLITYVQLTMVEDYWVTDASVSEVYGCEAHVEIHADYAPERWAYID